jgi:hypothetical protein
MLKLRCIERQAKPYYIDLSNRNKGPIHGPIIVTGIIFRSPNLSLNVVSAAYGILSHMEKQTHNQPSTVTNKVQNRLSLLTPNLR